MTFKPPISLARRLLVVCLAVFGATLAVPTAAEEELDEPRGLLFSYFMGNGEDGLHIAASDDGLTWTAVNGGKSLLRPEVGESKLMRDPSITQAPDGTFHMVWTTSWKGMTIGYAHSKDLIRWSKQKAIPVMAHEPTRINCWAPEIFYDARSKQYYVVWATTIPGRFPTTEKTGDAAHNHRLYHFTTKDFKTIGPTKLIYEPGINVIDGALVRDDARNRYAFVVKNETRHPPAKNLFMTYAKDLAGPWTPPSKPFSGLDWAEGPSIVRIGELWYCYWDKYTRGRYGAATSPNLELWSDISSQVSFPKGTRHGTAFYAPEGVVEGLKHLKAD